MHLRGEISASLWSAWTTCQQSSVVCSGLSKSRTESASICIIRTSPRKICSSKKGWGSQVAFPQRFTLS